MKFNIINGLSNAGKSEKLINKYLYLKTQNKKCISILNKLIYDKDLAIDKWYSKNVNVYCNYDYCVENNIISIIKKLKDIDYLFLDEAYSYSLNTLEEIINIFTNENIEIYVANFTNAQIELIKNKNIYYNLEILFVKCNNCDQQSEITCPDFTTNITENYCFKCYNKKVNEIADEIKNKLSNYPLMPKKQLYQPFLSKTNNFYFNLNNVFTDFNILRSDTNNRIDIYLKHHDSTINSYIDLGCNTGYFCDYMSDILRITNVYGIDICSTLIDICIKKSKYILMNNNKYTCSDLYDYFLNTDKNFDVISAYSVIQWVMGDEYGIILLKKLATIVNKILILEIGDYKEHHYDKLKIPIGSLWLVELLKDYFKEYIIYDKETFNLKKDIIYFFK